MAQDPYALSDEDRLPWLEPVDADDEPRRASPMAWVGGTLIVLLLLAIGIGGYYWWQNRVVEPSGTGELIAAPEGPYKVKPAEAGGMEIEGQGATAFATSEGAVVEGRLDLGDVPETPAERAAAAERAKPAQAGASASAAVSRGGQIVAKAPPAPAAAEEPTGSLIQLGAFPSAAVATTSFLTLQKRFAYLGERKPVIVKAEVNGRTFHRLRVGAASPEEARDLCARLRVAGENCLVVN